MKVTAYAFQQDDVLCYRETHNSLFSVITYYKGQGVVIHERREGETAG